jgi:APA family basic amino acid/polyamine antiporter
VVVANMIGTGIFTSTGFLAADLGSPWLLLAVWAAGGVIAIAGAACYAELATSFPESGGEFVYLREILGPLPAFLSGWTSFVVGFSAPTAAAALAFAAYLEPFVPGISPEASEPLWTLGDPARPSVAVRLGPGQGLAIVVVIAFGAIHALGVRPGARAQTTLTTFKVGLLVAFLAAGFLAGAGDAAHLARPLERAAGAPLPAAFAVSLVLVMFSYSGFNAAAYLGGEVRDPARTLPRALLAGTGLVAFLYVALNGLFLYARPLADYAGRVNVGEIAADALFGPKVAGLFGLLMAGALLSTVSAMMMAGPRVTWAMARRGAFPGWAGRVDPATGTPVRAIALHAIVAAAMAVTGTMISLMTFIGFALSLFAALTVGALLVHRWRGGPRGAYRAPLHPLAPLLFCAVSVWMMLQAIGQRPIESLAAGLVLAVGAALFWLAPRADPRRPPGAV